VEGAGSLASLLEPCKVEESLTSSEELGNLGIKQELQVVLKSELTSLQMSVCVCVCVCVCVVEHLF